MALRHLCAQVHRHSKQNLIECHGPYQQLSRLGCQLDRHNSSNSLIGAEPLTIHAPPDQPTSARAYLREATAHLHAKVDAKFAPLLEGDDMGYHQFLLRSAAAVLPLEQALQSSRISEILPDWHQRSRSAALREDLAALSLPEPPCQAPPAMRGEAFQFGVAYVLEGSRLGARMLLDRAIGPGIRQATRYLAHGAGLSLWQTFVIRLEASSAVRTDSQEALAGADAAFKRFLDAEAGGLANGA
jgi:heme oxygenase (biliverdin-IX-beta and delta-forming)